jgi:hypothetical protein
MTCHAQRRPDRGITAVKQNVDELTVASSADDPLRKLGYKLGMTLERLPGIATRQDLHVDDRSIGKSSSETLGSELAFGTFRNNAPPNSYCIGDS